MPRGVPRVNPAAVRAAQRASAEPVPKVDKPVITATAGPTEWTGATNPGDTGTTTISAPFVQIVDPEKEIERRINEALEKQRADMEALSRTATGMNDRGGPLGEAVGYDTPESRRTLEEQLANTGQATPGVDSGRERMPEVDNSLAALSPATIKRLKALGVTNLGDDRVYGWVRGPSWNGPGTGDDIMSSLAAHPSGEVCTKPDGDFIYNGDTVLISWSRAEQQEFEKKQREVEVDFVAQIAEARQGDVTHGTDGTMFHLGDIGALRDRRADAKKLVDGLLAGSPTSGMTLEDATRGKGAQQMLTEALEFAMRGRPVAEAKLAEKMREARTSPGGKKSFAFPSNPLAK